jgi:hypothetical protein
LAEFNAEIGRRGPWRNPLKTEMDDAIRLLKTGQMKGLPHDAPAIGVVRESARRDLLHDALIAEQSNFNLAQYLCTAGDLVTGAFSPGVAPQPRA